METKKTHLYQIHIDLKAKMAPFAGFEMPLQYSSVKEEVLAVRNNCGMFDVSHMGEFFITGKDAISFVDYLITNDFKNADLNKAVYSPLCRDNGTVIDDLIAYKLSETKVLICVNASNIEKDWSWITKHKGNFDVSCSNLSDDYSLIAVQGPQTENILKSLELLEDKNHIYYSAFETAYNGNPLILARTGYTGEDGFEIFCKNDFIKKLWELLMSKGVTPCGLVARDVLRLEVCFPLYGHELTDDITPLDANLKWAVKIDKEKFIGKDSLLNYSQKFQMVKLSLEKGIPREGHLIVNSDGEKIGKITSGTMSVVNNFGIGLGLVEKKMFIKDAPIFIQIREKNIKANLHTKPFVIGGHK